MTDDKPEHLKGWLDRPPLSEWSDYEKDRAMEALQALASLDHDKAIWLARHFVTFFEKMKAEWNRPENPWRDE